MAISITKNQWKRVDAYLAKDLTYRVISEKTGVSLASVGRRAIGQQGPR